LVAASVQRAISLASEKDQTRTFKLQRSSKLQRPTLLGAIECEAGVQAWLLDLELPGPAGAGRGALRGSLIAVTL